MSLYGIVLAAGQGTRMKSKLYKVLHPVCGKPMVGHVAKALKEAGINRTIVIVGHGAEAVQSYLGEQAEYAIQDQQLGTGHAVLQAAPLLASATGTTVVICGDTPLITSSTIKGLMRYHEERSAAVTILTAILDNPTGYGRVIRGKDGSVARIVEQKECTAEETAVQEINTGTYCFDNKKLFEALQKVTNNNAQGEYYLPDVIEIMKASGYAIEGLPAVNLQETIGVNDRVALSEAESLMRARINRQHMEAGVTIIDPQHTYIEADVVIGADTVIYPGTVLRGDTQIGEQCELGPQSEIADSMLGTAVSVKHSVLHQAVVGDRTTIGPFAYLRPGAKLGPDVKIGDFVEVKNSTIGEGSKVPHLSYVGDSDVGSGVNIGCGAITANYDGVHKHRTVIEDQAFIGSNTNLIAPVRVGKGAYVVAGSTITKDVPPDSLAIARERQTNKEGYAIQMNERRMKSENRER